MPQRLEALSPKLHIFEEVVLGVFRRLGEPDNIDSPGFTIEDYRIAIESNKTGPYMPSEVALLVAKELVQKGVLVVRQRDGEEYFSMPPSQVPNK